MEKIEPSDAAPPSLVVKRRSAKGGTLQLDVKMDGSEASARRFPADSTVERYSLRSVTQLCRSVHGKSLKIDPLWPIMKNLVRVF